MKIAFTGNVFPFSHDMAYGGERILLYLVEELHKFGHDVYLFAREGTKVKKGTIKDYIPIPALRNDEDVHFKAVMDYVENKGVMFDMYMCNYFGDGWDPVCQGTFAGYSELTWCRWCHNVFQFKQPSFNVVSYSKVLQQDFYDSGVPTTMIHYGIPRKLYKLRKKHDGYAVWIGKIEGGKAPHLAIKLALAAGLKIVIMGPPYNTGCFWEQVAPYIDNDKVFWVRGVDDKMKQQIMSRAKVFISSNDNTWKEHFGIVNIESLAMGTPILAFNRIGQDCAIAVDQIIENDKHGYFLDYRDSKDEDEIISKGVPLLEKIGKIKRDECRKQFVENFTSEKMAARYDWFFDQIVTHGKKFGTVEVPF